MQVVPKKTDAVRIWTMSLAKVFASNKKKPASATYAGLSQFLTVLGKKKEREAWILSCSCERCTKHINLLSFDMLCSACYDNLVTYLNKFLHQKADVCLNKTQISTLLAVLQIHDTSNTRTGSEVLLDKFLSPEPSLWKFFTDFDGLCYFLLSFLQYGSVSGSNSHGWQLSSLLRRAIPERNLANLWKEIWKRHGYLHTKMLEVLWAAFWVSSKFFFPLQEISLNLMANPDFLNNMQLGFSIATCHFLPTGIMRVPPVFHQVSLTICWYPLYTKGRETHCAYHVSPYSLGK